MTPITDGVNVIAIEHDDGTLVPPIFPADPWWPNWLAANTARTENKVDTAPYVAEYKTARLAELEVWFAGLMYTAADGWVIGLDESTRNAFTGQLLALQVLSASNSSLTLPLRFGAVTTPAYTLSQAAAIGAAYLSQVDAALSAYYQHATVINTATTCEDIAAVVFTV